MALSRPQTPFAHRRTVRLIVDNDMDIDELKIAKSLPDFATKIRGIVPQFGGRCFDITLDSTDAAAQLAQSGFDYGDVRKPLKLLGARTIHVSIFLSGSTEDLSEVRGGRSHGSRLSEAAMLQLWGHVASECELDPLCGICLQSDHHVSECPFLIFSANVEPNLHSTPST